MTLIMSNRYTRRRSISVMIPAENLAVLRAEKPEFAGKEWGLAGTEVTRKLEKGVALYQPTTFPNWEQVLLVCQADQGVLNLYSSQGAAGKPPRNSADIRPSFGTDQFFGWERSKTVRLDCVYDIRTGVSSDDWHNWLDQYYPQSQRYDELTAGDPVKHPRVVEENALAIMWEPMEMGDSPSLSLMAPSKAVADAVITAVFIFVRQSEEKLKSKHNVELKGWLRVWWREADRNSAGSLDIKKLWHFLRRRNLAPPLDETMRKFQLVNLSANVEMGNQSLNPAEFLLLMRVLFERNEISAIYDMNSSGFVMTVDEVRKFMVKQGNIDATQEDALARIREWDIHSSQETSNKLQEPCMSQEGFRLWFSSDEFSVIPGGREEEEEEEMGYDQPMFHYNIQGALNRQPIYHLVDERQNTQEVYVFELMRGSKFLVLDVWDGGNGKPRVFHDVRMKSGIRFYDLINGVIRTHAFQASDLPFWLMLEMHCSHAQQVLVAEALEKLLGSKIWRPKGPWTQERISEFTPNNLRGKIILLVKGNGLKTPSKKLDHTSIMKTCEFYSKDSPEDLSPELQNLISLKINTEAQEGIFAENPEFKEELIVNVFDEIDAAKLMLGNERANSISFHARHLTVVRPSVRRQDETNPDPMAFWLAGIQVVTLDLQIGGYGGMLNRSFYRRKGLTGYRLKPNFMRIPNKQRFLEPPMKVSLTIISGVMLPRGAMKPPDFIKGGMSPFVIIRAIGHPRDAQQRFVTSPGSGGLNPIWHEKFELRFYMPELAFISFLVKTKDQGTDGRGQKNTAKVRGLCYTIKSLLSMALGYRHVQMLNADGTSAAPATLLIHIERTPFEQKN